MHTLKPGWKMVKFGDVVRQCKEKVDRSNNPFQRYIEGGHIDSEDIHIRRWGEFGSDYVGPAFHRIFRKGQVLYGSRRTYLKKVAVADFDGITANTTFVCETKDQNIFMQELLPFLMLTESFTNHSIRESKGSTNPYINWPDIAKYEFPLPPLEEQKRLAELLWAADEAVEKWNITYADMEYLLQTTRNDIFQKFSQTESHVPLKNIGHWVSGATPSRARKDFWNGSFPWVSPKDMKYDTISDSQEKITDATLTKRTPILPKDSILIVVRGMILAHTFPVARTLRDVTINQDMKGIIPSKYFLCDFIFHWFKNNDRNFLKLTEESTHGTKRISTDILFSMNIPKPPLEEQKKAVILLNRIMNEISAIKSKIDINILLKKKLYNNLVGFSHV